MFGNKVWVWVLFIKKNKEISKKFQRKLMIVNESYTSKTCTKCGNIDRKLGYSKLYNCKKCSLEIDIDINGARNIFIKNYMGQDEGL
jgi:putative transposase